MSLDEEGVLAGEFDRIFSRESPEAIQWAFQVWRDKSPFFPAVSEIRKLVLEFRRGQREQERLRAELDEKFLLEERRRQGQVPDYQEVVKQLRDVVEKMPEPEKRKPQMSTKMRGLMEIVPTLHLSEDQIAVRREKERAECERYRSHANNEFNL
jgi:hypothetical protein